MTLATYKRKQYFERLPNNAAGGILEAVMFYTEDFMVVKLQRKQIYVFVRGGLFT